MPDDRYLLDDAYEISRNVVASNEGGLGIYAGSTHFKEYWSRDSLFTLFGSVKDMPGLAKKNIETFMDYQSDDGQIPLTISETDRWLRVLGFEKLHDKPFYRYDYPLGGKAQDSNLLFILAFDRYVEERGDLQFLHDNFEKVEKAINWSKGFEVDGLILEGKITNWMDTLLYSGYNLYTNVLYYAALLAYRDLVIKAGKRGYESYEESAFRVGQKINEVFWRGNYYSRWSDDENFSGSGNSLAMLYGIPSQDQSIRIIQYIEEKGLSHQPLLEADKRIPIRKRRKVPSMGGMYQYWKHPWPWIGAIYSAALVKYDEALSKKMINKIAHTIVTNGTTLEIVDLEGNRARSRVYTSEKDFSWSAGTFLFAYNQLDL